MSLSKSFFWNLSFQKIGLIHEMLAFKKRIGWGAAGVVYQLGEKAVKIPYLRSIIDLSYALREIWILRQLAGTEGIVEMEEFGATQQGQIYFIMPLYLDLTQVNLFRQLDLVVPQLLRAVCQCHSQEIIHRDLKPQNILWDARRDRILLADFGTATFWNGDPRTDLITTLPYRAPEVLIEGNRGYDYAVDLWSLGCVIYYLAKGRDLFASSTVPELLNEITELLGPSPFWEKPSHKKIMDTQFLNLPVRWRKLVESCLVYTNRPTIFECLGRKKPVLSPRLTKSLQQETVVKQSSSYERVRIEAGFPDRVSFNCHQFASLMGGSDLEKQASLLLGALWDWGHHDNLDEEVLFEYLENDLSKPGLAKTCLDLLKKINLPLATKFDSLELFFDQDSEECQQKRKKLLDEYFYF